jgi:hypothetical protein
LTQLLQFEKVGVAHGNKTVNIMRTKTLFLTALGSLSALGLMAQTSTNVYSLNAVGYINVTVQPGFNMIADQLWASGGNSVSNVLSDSNDSLDGVTIYKWTGTSFITDNANNQVYSSPSGWSAGGQETLNPGEAIWFEATNTMTLTFVGTVPQGTNTVLLNTGFTMASSPVPQSGDLVTVMGLTNETSGDTVFVYNNPGGYTTYNYNVNTGSTGYGDNWLPPGDPMVNVGQGFWYEASAPINFTRVFSVNQ